MNSLGIVKKVSSYEKIVLVCFRNAATAIKNGDFEKAQEWKERAELAQDQADMLERIHQRLNEKS
jgi:hypothetical protein